QNIEPGELPEGVLAFAEPYRDRMVLPIDEPSDALYRLITHELTHIFEFDIIPRSLLHRQLPLWVDEGLSDYMTGYWQPCDLMAVAAGNRKDQELDIVLMSTKDGKIIRNLTSGFNQNHGYEYIATPGGFRNNAVSWMSWAPAGDRIAYFARTEKNKTLILQNVVTKKIERRIELKTVDMPESPEISPSGQALP